MSDKWQVLKEKELLHTSRNLRVACQHVRLPNGVDVKDYYRIDIPEYTAVYARTETGYIVCLEQYKHGVGRVCLTLPGGIIEKDESAEICAQRELIEETGYICDQLVSLGSFVINGNQYVSKAHLFLGVGASKIVKANSGDLESMRVRMILPEDLEGEVERDNVPIIAHALTIVRAGVKFANLASPRRRVSDRALKD